jgi:glycosyltransferase involved in cell wall biosynthesis
MNVVLFSNEYPPFIFGGVGTFVKDLAFGLNRLGVKITVITGYPVPGLRALGVSPDDSRENKEGIRVIRFPYPNIPPRHLTFQLLNLGRFGRTVADVDADIIHGQCGSTYPALLNFRNLAPIIMTYHGSLRTQRALSYSSLTRGGSWKDIFTYGLGYPTWNYSFKKELQNSAAAVAVSENLMRQLSLEMNCKKEEKMRYIHNGVDLETLDNACSTASRKEDEPDPVILYGGRLFWSKGALNLLSLAALLQKTYRLNLKILIYGSGPLYNHIKQKARENALSNIVLKDFTSRDEFLQVMKKAAFVVIPSYYEASPMVLLESMCMGRIPVMFNLPYAREFTRKGRYGILARDVKDMGARINSIYRQDDMENLEKAIRDFARREYDVNQTAMKYYNLYKEICN